MTPEVATPQFQLLSVEELTLTSSKSESKRAASVSDFHSLSTGRKFIVLFLLCTTLFVDSFNSLSLLTALPTLSVELNIPDNESVWLFGAYQIAFAGLLLVSGRISDLYNPKYVFLIGSALLTIFTLGAGFVHKKIPLILLRALMGAGAALTVPSAGHLVVHMFPDPEPQAKALAVFSGMGGLGLVFGLFIGAVYVEFVSWPWVFHFGAIVSGAITIAVLLLVPNLQQTMVTETRLDKALRFKRLDVIGVSSITAGLILFIFAVTSGSSAGWGSAQVIVSLILSILLMVGFAIYEAYIPEDFAALPPKIWTYENVSILIASTFIPFMWWGSIYPLIAWFWQVVDDWSPMKVAVHFLPISIGILLVTPFVPGAVKKISPKWIILIGFIINLIGDILLPFDNASDRYWRFGFTGFSLGTIGATVIYTTINILLISNTPPEISGVISGVFIAAGQTGCAAGLSIVTSIQTSVQKHHGGPFGFDGRAAGLWFLFAITAVFGILVLIFMKDTGPLTPPTKITAAFEETERQPLSYGDVLGRSSNNDDTEYLTSPSRFVEDRMV